MTIVQFVTFTFTHDEYVMILKIGHKKFGTTWQTSSQIKVCLPIAEIEKKTWSFQLFSIVEVIS